MAGKFELVAAEQGGVRIRLVNGAGNILAVSGIYRDSAAAASGVTGLYPAAVLDAVEGRLSISNGCVRVAPKPENYLTLKESA